MLTYSETDKIINSGNVDEIRKAIKADPKHMIKCLIYNRRYEFAVAAINEVGPCGIDKYITVHLPTNHLVNILTLLDPRFVFDGIGNDKSREKALAVDKAFADIGIDSISLALKYISESPKDPRNIELGIFIGIIYAHKKMDSSLGAMAPIDIMKYERSYLMVSYITLYLASIAEYEKIIALTIYAIRMNLSLCIRSIFYRLEVFKDLPASCAVSKDCILPHIISYVCRVGNYDTYLAVCSYCNISLVKKSMTADDVDNLGRCGAFNIIKTLPKDMLTSSLLYHAAYNDHVNIVRYILGIREDGMLKAIDSAVKGMAVNVMIYLVRENPILCMQRVPQEIIDHVIECL